MSAVIRGTKNVLRNPIRTGSVVLLLGVVIAFALSMLVANQAVKNKITDLKTTGATVLTIRSAGNGGPFSAGEPLTNAQLADLKNIPHVADTSATLQSRIRFRAFTSTNGAAGAATAFAGPEDSDTAVDPGLTLESSIDAGTLGIRQFGGTAAEPPKLPVRLTGVAGMLDENGQTVKLTQGTGFSGEDVQEAVIGTNLATKNNLKIGSTFKAYDMDFKVVGIFDGGTAFANDEVKLPLKTVQRLSKQGDEITVMQARVDSIDNIDSTLQAIKDRLGANKVDVTSSAQNTQDAITSLKGIERISIAGVLIAVLCGIAVVFLVMVMIVRERKREIAVLKAIGAGNFKIAMQFVSESIALTSLSLVIAVAATIGMSGQLTKALVATNTKTANTTERANTTFGGPAAGGVSVSTGGSGGGGFRSVRLGGGAEQTSTKELLNNVKTQFGVATLVEAFGLVVLIGALGSALPAFVIAKIRPSDVMRGNE